MSDHVPPSGPRVRRHFVKTHVLVTVEHLAETDDSDINCTLAVEAALQGLDVPGATVLRVSAAPHDGDLAAQVRRGIAQQ